MMPGYRWSRVYVWLVSVVLLSAPGLVRAELSLELRSLQREIFAGEPFQVELSAMSDGGHSPERPDLVVPSGFEVAGPRVSTRQHVTIVNFRAQRQHGITATWQLQVDKPGTYSLGPGSVELGGQTHQAEAVQIQVLPQGQKRRRPRRRRRRDPFGSPFGSLDPFGPSGMDDLFDQMMGRSSSLDRLPEAPVELQPEDVVDPRAFVHAEVVPARAVVGQQLTLRVYAYGGRGLFQEAGGGREPSYSDFLAHRIVENPSGQTVYRFEHEGHDWLVVKVREVALFPLKPGKLTIGSMSFGFLGRRYGGMGQRGLVRETKPLSVEVVEPPLAGRPPGFVGDVGRFRMRAEVQPREVEAGGAISVKVALRGKGRFPASLKVPEQSGVEWDEPTVVEETELSQSTVGGRKTFSYVVRLEEPGDIALGAVRLPLYDPQSGSYRVIDEELGRVLVRPSTRVRPPADAPAGNDVATERLSDTLSFREQLRPLTARVELVDQPWFLWSLGVGPLGVTFATALRAGLGRLRRVKRRRSSALDRQAMEALRSAQRLAGEEDPAQALALWERALYLALEHASGVRARGVLRAELSQLLSSAGLQPELVASSISALESIEQARFAGASELGRLQRELPGVVRRLCEVQAKGSRA